MSGKLLWDISKGTITDFMEDKALRLSAALAYYATFSLAPLLIIVIAVAAMVFGEKAVRGEVQRQIEGIVGPRSAETIQSMLVAAQKHETSVIATIVGVVTLLLGASGVFGQLQDALNTIWEVKPKPGRGLAGFMRDRFLSLTMVLGTGFLLLISMVVSTVIEALTGAIGQVLAVPGFAASAVNLVVSFGVAALLFAMIFKVLPDVTIKWRDVWVGALCTAVLFTLGKFLLSRYLGRESTASAYGASGSFVVILLWIYYSSIILFLGAEFTQVYATQTGSRIVPSPNAIPVTEDSRANEGMTPSDESLPSPALAPETRERKPSRRVVRVPAGARAAAAEIQRDRWSPAGLALGIGIVTAWVIARDLRSRRLKT